MNLYRKIKKPVEPEILFEDQSIIVANKPGNFLTVPDRWNPEKINLLSWLQSMDPDRKITVIQRMDYETSGLLIFAKTAAAHQFLCNQYENHKAVKNYYGLVSGVIQLDNGIIDAPLGPHGAKRGLAKVKKTGKSAITYWEVLEQFQQCTLLKITPQTERMHQIRVHMRHFGHPLLADGKYGNGQEVYLSQFKKKYNRKTEQPEKPLLDRLALHAGEIKFQHPDSQNEQQVLSAYPKDFNILLNKLRKFSSRN